MGQKMVRFSDLSGEIIPDEDKALARIVIHEHPELGGSPVEIEVLADEALAAERAAVPVVLVELHLPGADEPRRVAIDVDAFDKMATDRAMSELLLTARPARATRRTAKAASSGSARGDQGGYASLDTAGRPHKGKVTDAEKQLVRENFDHVNERLATEGQRTIDLDDPEHVDRYGLADLAEKRGAGKGSRRGHLTAAATAGEDVTGEAGEELPGQTAIAV